jgi:hypothetical protein
VKNTIEYFSGSAIIKVLTEEPENIEGWKQRMKNLKSSGISVFLWLKDF